MNRFLLTLSLLIIYLFPVCHPDTAWPESVSGQDDPLQLIARGNEYCNKGDMQNAAVFWKKALNLLDPGKDPDTCLETTFHLASAFQAMGYHRKALSLLQKRLPFAEKSNTSYHKALFFNALGDLHLSLGDTEKAADYLLKGVEQARKSENPRALIMLLNNIGNGLSADRNYTGALDLYDQSLELIEKSEGAHDDLKPKVLLNMVRLGLEMKNHAEVADTLDSVLLQIADLPDYSAKGSDLITLSRLIRKFRKKLEDRELNDHLVRVSFLALHEARRIGEDTGNSRVLAYANGYMGALYEDQKQYADALKLTRKAIFFAQQDDLPEILYLWQWQAGRLFQAEGQAEDALDAYKNAIGTLNPIRQELFKGFRSKADFFDETVKPVYLGLANLLLRQAETAEGSDRERKLLEARETMETLKTAELEDFFADECLRVQQTQGSRLERTPPHTAILYPIMLPDRLVLLLTLPDRMMQMSSDAGAGKVRETVSRYRERLQTRPNNRFRHDSQQIYDWVIRPLETALMEHAVDTLIVSPDGALRLIPFSTLNDGTQFLIEKYAVVTIPAISLTDPSPVNQKDSEVLVAGLSESRQGFPALPGVTAELGNIREIMDAGTVMENADYTTENLTREFRDNEYGVLHIATHGIFGGTPDESFLLTYNDRLNMNQLERLISLGRFREQKVELLTLSACQTALGNERAAMGLAGVAVKAGVKSVLATLWYVDDEATALAVREFYRQFRTPGVSKAKAMQNVQKKMISQQRYRHPLYWGPFLVIGNWL